MANYVSRLVLLMAFLSLWMPKPVLTSGSIMEEAKEKSESWLEWAHDKLTDEQMKKKAGDIATRTKEKVEGAKDKIKDGATDVSGDAEKAFERAKKNAEKALGNAKDTMTESAKAKYDEAKERVSKTTGGLGAKMEEL